MDAEQVLAWHASEEGRRWAAIGQALARGDEAWAFRLLCEMNTPADALIVLDALLETVP